MKKHYTKILIAMTLILLFALSMSAAYSARLYGIIQTQVKLSETQQQTIQNQEETIHLLESWIKITDPKYIIMWEKPCRLDWHWSRWATELEK